MGQGNACLKMLLLFPFLKFMLLFYLCVSSEEIKVKTLNSRVPIKLFS
jgi:hypothetical protein